MKAISITSLVRISFLFLAMLVCCHSAAFGAGVEELKANLEKMLTENADALKAASPSKEQLQSLAGIVAAADELLKQNPPDELRNWTHAQRTKALIPLIRITPRDYLSGAITYLTELDNTSGCAETARLLRFYVLMGRLSQMGFARNTPEAEFNSLVEETATFIKDNPGVASERLSASLLFIGKVVPERNPTIETQKIAEIFKELSRVLNPRTGAANPENAISMNRLIVMYELPGKEMEIKSVDLNGGQFDIASLRGKLVLVDFWATWCGPCKAAFPKMKTIYEKYKDDGFEILGLSADKDDTMRALMNAPKNLDLPWIIVSETKALNERQIPKLTEKYGIITMPKMILIGKDGKVLNAFVTMENLESELDKHLGKNIPKDPMRLPNLGTPAPTRPNSGLNANPIPGLPGQTNPLGF